MTQLLRRPGRPGAPTGLPDRPSPPSPCPAVLGHGTEGESKLSTLSGEVVVVFFRPPGLGLEELS